MKSGSESSIEPLGSRVRATEAILVVASSISATRSSSLLLKWMFSRCTFRSKANLIAAVTDSTR